MPGETAEKIAACPPAASRVTITKMTPATIATIRHSTIASGSVERLFSQPVTPAVSRPRRPPATLR